jgi:hypothetical protein
MMCAIYICYLVIIFPNFKMFFFWVKLPYFLVVNDDVFIDF